METKKSKSGLVIGILVVLVLALGGYLVYDKVIKKEEKKEPVKVEKKEKKEVKEVKVDKPISFDKTKCINNDLSKKEGTFYRNGGTWGFNDTRFSIDESKGAKVVEGNITTRDDNGKEVNNNIDAFFDKRVEQIFYGVFDSMGDNATILFLMEDGTVEYAKIVDIEKTKEINHKKIESVSGVVQFDNILIQGYPVGENWLVIAYKSDGTYYDLSKFISFN